MVFAVSGFIFTSADAHEHVHDPAHDMCSRVHAAAYLDEPDELARLIEAGVDLNCRDSLNQTPLITAIDGASIEVVAMLLARGVELNERDELGETALAKARLKAIGFQVQGGKTYQDIYLRIIHMLEDAGAIEYADKGGQIPGVQPPKP